MRPAFTAIALAIGLFGCRTATGGDLHAGAATIEITPPIGFPMWGYANRHDAPSTGVAAPLFARAVVIDDGTAAIAIVSLDLGRPPTRSHAATIRSRIEKAGIGQMFLVASHTHHGPVLELDNWPTAQNSYASQLADKIGDVILEAHSNRRAARLGAVVRDVPFNRNRQSKRPDRPVDRDLRVLRLEAADGKVFAHLVNFAAHPTMIASTDRRFSPDFPGSLARRVEAETKAPCLFLQGAAGDLSTKPPQGVSGPDAFGEVIAKEVLDMSKSIRAGPVSGAIRSSREEMHFRVALDLSNPLVKLGLSRAFFPELVDFYESEYAQGVRSEFTTALIGDSIGFVGFSGEMFCGHALSLKRRARLEHLFVFGCCNDYQQYFPTIEAQAEGGYGTAPPVAMAEVGAGEKLADQALIHLYRLSGKIPK